MRKIYIITLVLSAGLFLTTSCDREKLDYELTSSSTGNSSSNGQDGPTGRLLKPQLTTTRSINTDEYLIGIYKENGEQVELLKYNEISEDGIVLKVGNYKLTASSHNVQPAEWDKPWYCGESDFTIEENKITENVDVTCKLKNLEVKIEFEDKLLALMDDNYKVTVEIGKGSLIYTKTQKDQNIAGYFYAEPDQDDNIFYAAYFNGLVDGIATIQTANGKVSKDTQTLTITFKLKSTNPDGNLENGTLNPSIGLDATAIIVDKNFNITIEEDLIEEDPVNPPSGGENDMSISGKDFNGKTFDIKNPITLPTNIPEEGIPVIVKINAPSGIKGLNVDIVSEKLTPVLPGVGLTDHLDLVNPGEFETAIKNLGFPVKEDVINKTELDFNITQFTPLLGIYGAGTHQFVINLTDNNDKSITETLIIITQ